ncbi:RNA-binding protein 7-like [Ostrea edulis]|uniref:RNA-binding protein 7-like n=1 Tax=Ostrea edulis TaxID=37623 RepID=UPI0024AFEF03|nr:RNA-binding protein 7-like [Ostrea edulis]
MDSRDRTLWVGNLSEKITEEILYELFLQAGPLEKVTIPVKDGRRQRFAFVTFKHECSVPYTMQLFDGLRVWGNTLRLQHRTGSSSSIPQSSPQESVPSGSHFNQIPVMHTLQRAHTWHGGRDPQGFQGQGGRDFHSHGNRDFQNQGSRTFQGHGSRDFQGPSSRDFQGHGSRDFSGHGSRDFQGHGSRDFQGHGGSHSRGSGRRDDRHGQEPQRMEQISLQGNHFYTSNTAQDVNPRDRDYYSEKRDRLMSKQKASLEIQRHRHEKRNRDHSKSPYDRGGHSQPWQERPYRQ